MRLRHTIVATVCLALVVMAWRHGGKVPLRTESPQAPKLLSVATDSHVPVPAADAPGVAAAVQADVFGEFGLWIQNWRSAPAAHRPELIEQGVKLAKERERVLYDLIAKQPEAALHASLSSDARRFLPAPVLPWIEQRIHQRGDLAVVAATPRRGQEHLIQRPIFREARVEGRAYDAYVYGRRAQQDTKYGSSLMGITVRDRIAVMDEPAIVIPLADVPAEARLSTGLALGDHVAPKSAARSAPVLAVQGQYYPICCAAHAALLAQRALDAENKAGPMVEALGGSGTSSTPAPPPLTTQGALKMLVIVADFADAPGRPSDTSTTPDTSLSTTYVTNRIDTEVSEFLDQVSYGKSSIGAVTVTPTVLRLAGSLATYATTNNATGIQSAALSAATTAGYVTSSYDRISVVFASTHNIVGNKFNWTGLGDVGGTFTWFNGDFSLHVVSHELGHNYGLRHANLWKVTDGNPVSAAGTSQEYGDPFDMMGSAPDDYAHQNGFPNPWFLNRIHWLPDAAVQTITTSGTYRVYRYDHRNAVLNTTLALRLGRDAATDYWVGYRRKYVAGPMSDISAGAYFVWGYTNDARSTLLDIDTPGTDSTDASLNVGNTFNDTAAGISFTVNAAAGSGTAEYLDVQVNFQPRLVFQKKSYSVDEQAGTASVVIDRRNNSTGAISAHYATVDGTALAGSDYTAQSGDLTWASGDASSRTITVPIVADAVKEGSESFSLVLSSVVGAAVPGGSTVAVTIQEAGATDATFIPVTLSNAVRDLLVQPDDSVLAAGSFAAAGSITSAGLVLMEPNGLQDQGFDQGPGAVATPVNTMARQPDGKVLVGGNFTTFRNVARNRIARLNVDGSLDNSFNPGTGPNGEVLAIAVQPDGRILVGGTFLTWNGSARKTLVRLNEDGSLDASFGNFDTVVDFFLGDETVSAIALQPTAVSPFFRILVGGVFYRPSTGAGFHYNLVALNASTGARDTTFDVSYGAHLAGDNLTGYPVTSLAVQPDGKVLVGGQFTAFNNVNCGHFIRLNNSGTNDSTFRTNSGSGLTGGGFVEVSDMLVQGDGRIMVAGHFTTASGVSQPCIARYLPSGSFDTTLRPSVPLSGSLLGAYALAMQSDGGVLIGLNGAGPGNTVRRFFTAQPQAPSVLTFSSTTATAVEGPNASLIVERRGGSVGPISVNYATVARTATAGSDYTTTMGTLTWADGDASSKAINVPVIDDGIVENDELFEVRLGIPVGGVLLGERQVASVQISAGDLSGVPRAEFAAASGSPGESAGTINVTVNVAPAPTSAITVPFTVSGTATNGAGKDYTVSASPLSFGIGETSKTISVNLLQDASADPNETVVLTLGSPSGFAVLGSITVHTLTIADDEMLPAITASPPSRMVSIGASTSFTAASTGNPLPTSYLWKKGTALIAGQSGASYTISNVQTTHGAIYTASAKSLLGTSPPSAGAVLAVADLNAKTFNYYAGNKAVLTIACSSNVTGFVWKLNNVNVNDVPGHIAGQGTKTLTITNIGTGDHGDYTCDVTSPTAGITTTTANIKVHVITNQPVLVDPITFSPVRVAESFNFSIADHINTADHLTPTSYSASPLPDGLKLNATTGVISGIPSIALTPGTSKNYAVVLKATNAQGSDSRTVNLVVNSLPIGSVGTFAGFVARNPGLNENLGGRVTLTPASNGSYSATIVNGATSHSYKGVVNATSGSTDVTGSFQIVRPGKDTLTFTFVIDSPNDVLKATTLTDGTNTETVNGWRNVTPTLAYQGTHNFGLALAVANPTLPQGTGYGSFKVASNGTLTVSGRLPDGVSYTTATFVGPHGEVLVHQVSSTVDTMLGALDVNPGVAVDFSDYLLNGTLSWSRKDQSAKTRLYKNAFGPVNLTATGGRYVVPAGTNVFKDLTYTPGVTLSNAALVFTDADFGDALPPVTPGVTVLVKTAGAVSVLAPNPRVTSLKVTPSSGAFSGLFSLVDPNPLAPSTNIPRSKVAYQGLVYRDGANLVARGYFLLNNLPRVALETSSNTDTVSGKVQLNKVP